MPRIPLAFAAVALLAAAPVLIPAAPKERISTFTPLQGAARPMPGAAPTVLAGIALVAPAGTPEAAAAALSGAAPERPAPVAPLSSATRVFAEPAALSSPGAAPRALSTARAAAGVAIAVRLDAPPAAQTSDGGFAAAALPAPVRAEADRPELQAGLDDRAAPAG